MSIPSALVGNALVPFARLELHGNLTRRTAQKITQIPMFSIHRTIRQGLVPRIAAKGKFSHPAAERGS
jgi:hypothetical protein